MGSGGEASPRSLRTADEPPEATETADQTSPPLSPLEPPAHTAQTADSTADGAEEEPTATEATTRPSLTSTPPLQLNDEASAQILQGYATDAWFTQPHHTEKLERRGEFWYSRGALVIPDLPDLKHQIMFEFHDIPISGHVGTEKTRRAILQHYWWPEIRKDVEHYVLTCELCQRNKATNQLPAGQSQPLQHSQNADGAVLVWTSSCNSPRPARVMMPFWW